jgi:hypothetical protein
MYNSASVILTTGTFACDTQTTFEKSVLGVGERGTSIESLCETTCLVHFH